MSGIEISRKKAFVSKIQFVPERLIKAGLLVLVALMPFHAFLSVWLGSVFGHQTLIQSWKEALLLVLCGLAAWQVWCQPQLLSRLRQPVVLTGAALLVLALVITAIIRPAFTATLFGLKTDFDFLVLFSLAALVADRFFLRRLVITALAAGIGVIIFGLIQIYVWPPDFLLRYGYGPDTIQPYLILDSVTRSLRFPSTLGGPNQLGSYLIIILSLIVTLGWSVRRYWLLTLLPPAGLVLLHTHSRAAWIGSVLALITISYCLTPLRLRRWYFGAAAVATVSLVLITPWLLSTESNFKHYLLHDAGQVAAVESSDDQHAQSLQNGFQAVLAQPLGHGLGTAGPAALRAGSGPIIENHYLQLAYEYGVVGLAIWLLLLLALVVRLWAGFRQQKIALSLLGGLVGVSAAAMFLPVWADSTLVFTFWTLAGAASSLKTMETENV